MTCDDYDRASRERIHREAEIHRAALQANVAFARRQEERRNRLRDEAFRGLTVAPLPQAKPSHNA